MSISVAESRTSSVNSENDGINNVVKLKLKKPKTWNWELSTSKSSPHICFPHILLYDDKNSLLAVTNEANAVINGARLSQKYTTTPRHSTSTVNSDAKISSRSSSKVSNRLSSNGSSDRAHIINSTELIDCSIESPPAVSICRSDSESSKHSKYKRSISSNSYDITEILDEVVSDLKRQGINCDVRRRNSSSSIRKCKTDDENGDVNWVSKPSNDKLSENIECVSNGVQSTPEVPIMVYSERGILRRNLNAKEFDSIRNRDNVKTDHIGSSQNGTSSKNGNDTRRGGISTPINSTTTAESINHSGKLHSNFILKKSKSALEVPTFSYDTPSSEKRKIRRKQRAESAKIDSTSYLERLSQFKRRSSSTDSQALDDFLNVCDTNEKNQPTYRLQSSPAGTLVVLEESVCNRKVRRRPRKCSYIYEEEEPLTCPEKVVHKYVYNGALTGADASNTPSERRTFKRSISERKELLTDTYNRTDKFASRYEKEIANIDCLISKVISSQTEPGVNKMGTLNRISGESTAGRNTRSKHMPLTNVDNNEENRAGNDVVSCGHENMTNETNKCSRLIVTTANNCDPNYGIRQLDVSERGSGDDVCMQNDYAPVKMRICKSASVGGNKFPLLSSCNNDNIIYNGNNTERKRKAHQTADDFYNLSYQNGKSFT